MAGKRLISNAAVQNPQHLMQILNGFVEELDEIRDLVTELKDDFDEHTHDVEHAACSASSAIYSTDTDITSTKAPAISASTPTKKVQGGK
ncbi:MAG: hypothetical protein ACLFUL_06300 [Desulfobacteraceae bacterium]